MKKLIYLAIACLMFASCSKMSYSYGGSAAGCTAFYPKKFKSNPKPVRPVKGPGHGW